MSSIAALSEAEGWFIAQTVSRMMVTLRMTATFRLRGELNQSFLEEAQRMFRDRKWNSCVWAEEIETITHLIIRSRAFLREALDRVDAVKDWSMSMWWTSQAECVMRRVGFDEGWRLQRMGTHRPKWMKIMTHRCFQKTIQRNWKAELMKISIGCWCAASIRSTVSLSRLWRRFELSRKEHYDWPRFGSILILST